MPTLLVHNCCAANIGIATAARFQGIWSGELIGMAPESTLGFVLRSFNIASALASSPSY